MIRDTCACGAQVEISLPRHTYEAQAASEVDHHIRWLASHESCRQTGIQVDTTTTETYEIEVPESARPIGRITVEWLDGDREVLDRDPIHIEDHYNGDAASQVRWPLRVEFDPGWQAGP